MARRAKRTQKYEITKTEQKYLLRGVLVIFVWFAFLKELIVPILSTMYIPLASLVYDMGLLYGIYIITKPLGGKTAMTLPIIGYVFWVGIDLLTPPFLVSETGVLSKSVELWYVSKDASVYTLLSGLGIPAESLYTYTYVVVPIILICLIPVWITNKKGILKNIK